MVTLLHGIALLLYGVAAWLLFGSLARGAAAPPRAGLRVATVAFGVHTIAVVRYVATFGELPLVGLAPSLSALGWLIGAFLLGIVLFRDASPLGLVLAPLVAVLLCAAILLGIHPAGEPIAFRGVWFSLHVVAAFVGYAGLTAAFAAGLLYLLQFRELKDKRFGRVFAYFPSLDTLDRVGHRALLIGYPALTLALVAGWAWTVRFRNSFGGSDPQVIWGVLTWLVFGAALLARATGAERERRAAVVTVVGFAIVIAAYLVLRLAVVEGRGFL